MPEKGAYSCGSRPIKPHLLTTPPDLFSFGPLLGADLLGLGYKSPEKSRLFLVLQTSKISAHVV